MDIKERPILFSAPMVRAILEGRKTQTRRVVKPQPHESCTKYVHEAYNTRDGRARQVWRLNDPRFSGGLFLANCPYGSPGHTLWVRETFNFAKDDEILPGENHRRAEERAGYTAHNIVWRADGEREHPEFGKALWRSPIHMPRFASRIDLLIKGIRVERLQDISDEDAIAEGLIHPSEAFPGHFVIPAGRHVRPVEAYEYLWESINGSESWAANPWVWVVEFERVKP